ncbi:MAG TPA: hypothetical protein VKD45_01190, partial [Hyphomicrobiaceae bacterium]|nr:hypothetical protein [Hyphomicrobiaceae bacterium]
MSSPNSSAEVTPARPAPIAASPSSLVVSALYRAPAVARDAQSAINATALFEARDLCIAFGGIRAVDGVTFNVREGE